MNTFVNEFSEDVSNYDLRTFRYSVRDINFPIINFVLPESEKTLELICSKPEGQPDSDIKEVHNEIKNIYMTNVENIVPLLHKHSKAFSIKFTNFDQHDLSWTDEIPENLLRVHFNGDIPQDDKNMPMLMIDFARLVSLKSIILENVHVPEDVLKSILQVPELVSLRIGPNDSVTGEHLGKLSKTLKILVLKTRVLDEQKVIEALSMLKNRGAQLQIVAFWQKDTLLTRAHWFALQQFDTLKKFDVSETPSLVINDETFQVPTVASRGMLRLNLLFQVYSNGQAYSALYSLFHIPQRELVKLELTDKFDCFKNPYLLERVLESSPILETLKLNNFSFALNADMFVAKQTLRKIKFTDVNLDDDFLMALIKGCPNISCITIIYTNNVSVSRFSIRFVYDLIRHFWYNQERPDLDFRAFELGYMKPLFSQHPMPPKLRLWIRLEGM